MARRKSTLRVVYSPSAQEELKGIWRHNALTRNARWADNYLTFLETHINALAQDYPMGKPVCEFPELLYITFKKRSKGDGHIAVYEVNETSGEVLVHHVFHTKQDIQGRLKSERE